MSSEGQIGRTFVYGLGSFAKKVLDSLGELNIKVDGFVDHVEKIPHKYWSTPCFHVSEIEFESEDIVYIGVCNLHGNLELISARIREINPSVKIVSPVQLAFKLNKKGHSFNNYWLTGDLSIYQNSLTRIDQFTQLLTDSQSKELLKSIIEYRTRGTIESLLRPDDFSDQYAPVDLPSPPQELNILELGSFSGEDLIRFQKRGFVFKSGFAFEPDLINYKHLVENLELNGILNIVPLPLGAWDETTTLSFDASGASGARLEESGANVVSVMKTDDFTFGVQINYIKMDIEGAESHAIDGARGLISRNRPHLAVSVYHEPAHLWELGLQINSIVPNVYNFYLRSYGHQTFDTVLYCIPRK